MSELRVDDKAPAFRLPAAQGGQIGLEEYRGRSNVILFFAKGMACGFCRQKMSQLARGLPRFRALDTEILEITPTPIERGRFYARNFHLPFPYLCDADYRVYETYGLPMRPHSMLWKMRVLRHALRVPQPETEFGPPKPTVPELNRVMNDDDLGFFVVDKDGLIRHVTRGPYVVVEGVKPVGMQPIPSNDEIVGVLEQCERRAARQSA
jgi:peroxiredoxin